MPAFFKKEKFRFVIYGTVILAIFYVFSFLVKEDIFTNFDFDMTVRIQNQVPVRLDPYLSAFSLLGSFEVTLVTLLVLIVVRKKIQGALLVGMFGFMHVVEILGKAFLDHPATPFMFHRYALDFFFPSGYIQPGGSYPSGHSMRTAYLAFLFLFVINKSKLSPKLKLCSHVAILAILAIMLLSRISLGEHWTTDVIGGSILGLAFALFSLVFI